MICFTIESIKKIETKFVDFRIKIAHNGQTCFYFKFVGDPGLLAKIFALRRIYKGKHYVMTIFICGEKALQIG